MRIAELTVGHLSRRLLLALGFLLWEAGGARIPAAEPPPFPPYREETADDYVRNLVQSFQSQVGNGPECTFLMARWQQQMGRQDEAERLAMEALKSAPHQAEIPSFLANLYIRQDRMEEASRFLKQAVELDPKIAGGYRRLGMVLDRLGDQAAARQALDNATRWFPQDAAARLMLGRLLLDQGLPKEAAEPLSKACQLDPTQAGAFYALSQAQARIGDAEGARESRRIFQKLKEKERTTYDAQNAALDPAKDLRILAAGIHRQAAAFFMRQKRVDLAEANLRQAIVIAPQESASIEALFELLIGAGRLVEARGVGEDLVRLRPKDAMARLNLGNLLLQREDYAAAVVQLKGVLELDPKQPQALNNLARYYLGSRQNLPEALDLCRQLVTNQPTAVNYDLLGWAYYANGRIDDARAAGIQAMQKDPTNRVYREHYQRLQPTP